MANPTIRTPFVRDFASKEFLTAPRMSELSRGVNSALRALADLTPDEVPPLKAQSGFHVTVNSPLTAPGCYDGFLVEYETTPIDTSSSSPPIIGNGTEEIVVLNTIDLELSGGSGHILTDGDSNLFTFPAQRWLPRTTTDGKRIAVISAVDYKICAE